jgi:hypothetical protein
MREGENLYFAPGIRFSDLRMDGREFVDQLVFRVDTFFLNPAQQLCLANSPFAAGVLIVCALDFLAGLSLSADEVEGTRVGESFRQFAAKYVRSFSTREIAQRFYFDVRNGLVHQGRIKNGGEFDLRAPDTVALLHKRLVVNPMMLLEEVREALSCVASEVAASDWRRKKLADRLQHQFKYEFAAVARGRRNAS